MAYQIFLTERNRSAGQAFGHPGVNNARVEGPHGGYATRAEALVIWAAWSQPGSGSSARLKFCVAVKIPSRPKAQPWLATVARSTPS